MMRSSRPFMLAVLLALAVLALSACGGASPSPSPTPSLTSGVQGKVMFSGGPAPGSQGPMPGVAVAVHEGDFDGKIVAKVTADSAGAFKLDLPPGTYTLSADVTGAGPKTVSVEPGKYARITLWDQVP
jgi:hypothetical protein